MRFILKALGTLIFVGIPAALGWVMGGFLIVGIAVTAFVKRYGYKHELARAVWVLILGVSVVLLFVTRVWPTPSNTESCSTSALPLASFLSPPASHTLPGEGAKSRTQVELYLDSFDQQRFELLQGAEYAEEGSIRVREGYRMLNALAKLQGDADLAGLQGTIKSLDAELDALSGDQASTLDKIRARRKQLESYLSTNAERSRELREADIPEFKKRFADGLDTVSLEGITAAISTLDTGLTSIAQKTIGGGLNTRVSATSTLSAEYIESGSRIELHERVNVLINNAEVSEIDASSLAIGSDVLRSRLNGATQRFDLYVGGVRQDPPQSLRSIRLPKGARDVTIDSILALDAPTSDACMKSPVLRFRVFRLSWPEPYPISLTTRVSVNETPIQNFPYRLESTRDTTIRDVRLPRNSFFASNFKFDVSKLGTNDVLKPAEPGQTLNVEYFRTQSIWIELIPRQLWWVDVQPIKHLVFRENAVAGIISLLFGVLTGFILTPQQTPEQKQQTSRRKR